MFSRCLLTAIVVVLVAVVVVVVIVVIVVTSVVVVDLYLVLPLLWLPHSLSVTFII